MESKFIRRCPEHKAECVEGPEREGHYKETGVFCPVGPHHVERWEAVHAESGAVFGLGGFEVEDTELFFLVPDWSALRGSSRAKSSSQPQPPAVSSCSTSRRRAA